MKKELCYNNPHSGIILWKYISECDMDLIKLNLLEIPANTLTEKNVNINYFN